MKKIYNLLLFALVLGLASCTGEVEDIFDKTSAKRVTEAIENDNKILQSAENGWVLSFYADPSNTTGFGGYNTYLKFNNDMTVTTGSELSQAINKSDSLITTHYNIHQSQGIILSFDEYNPYIQVFSDPVNKFNIGSAGTGLEGDLEFQIISISKDKVILKGKKTGIELQMVPAARPVENWADEIDAIFTVEEEMLSNKKYGVYVEDTPDTLLFARSEYRMFSYTDSKGDVTNIPFIITEKGIEFKEPFKINEKYTIEGFKYEAEKDTYVATNNEKIKIFKIVPPLYETLYEGTWYFSGDLMSETAYQYFSSILPGTAAIGEDIRYFALEADGKGNLVFYFNSGGYGGGLAFKFDVISNNQVKLTYNSSNNSGDANWYLTNVPAYKNIVTILNGTFDLEADNLNSPSYILMSRNDAPTYNFKIVPRTVTYPLGK